MDGALFNRGDQVRYCGEARPDEKYEDLVAGEIGEIVDVAPDGAVVVSWEKAATQVHLTPNNDLELVSRTKRSTP
jgi:hypothetical protein